jgi:hypothetical protein
MQSLFESNPQIVDRINYREAGLIKEDEFSTGYLQYGSSSAQLEDPFLTGEY